MATKSKLTGKLICGTRYKLYPTDKQIVIINKNIAATRFIWNGLVAANRDLYIKNKDVLIAEGMSEDEAKKKARGLTKENSHTVFNSIVNNPDNAWVKECPSPARDNVELDYWKAVNAAFKRFVKTKELSFPKFHSFQSREGHYVHKRNIQAAFWKKDRTAKGVIELSPGLGGNMRYRGGRAFPPLEELGAITLVRDGEEYFLSVGHVRNDVMPERPLVPEEILGIDLGVSDLLITSNNDVIKNPYSKGKSTFKANKEALDKAQQRLSRKIESYKANSPKTKMRDKKRLQIAKRVVNKLHKRQSRQRDDLLHNISHRLTTENSALGMETLNVKGMMDTEQRKEKKLGTADSLQKTAISKLNQMIDYKAKFNGCHVIRVENRFASTQLCYHCGNKQKMPLSQRKYICQNVECDSHANPLSRDHNAALNIRRRAMELAA